YVKYGHIYWNKKMLVPAADFNQFKLAASVIDELKGEIQSNSSFANESLQSLVSLEEGKMLSGLNEVLVGAYYKYLGITVTLQSSKDSGKADIDMINLPFATDTKLYPDAKLQLEAAANDARDEILKAVAKVANQGLRIHVLVPDRKRIKASLKLLAETFEDQDVGHYQDSTIIADIGDNNYEGSDFYFTVTPQNVNVYFQANWDMAPSVEMYKEKIQKAIKQVHALGKKEAIPFTMIPRDAKKYAGTMNVLRFFAHMHLYVQDDPNIFILPLYSIDFEGVNYTIYFDTFETGSNTLKINHETFSAFVTKMLSRKEIFG
ncbi:MAG: hypothetical protein JWM07_646, partial [Candidatus Saccharibacteria bacterium]|nr:hypothetical protein [Candidatus Saccharibacteria bacterium]